MSGEVAADDATAASANEQLRPKTAPAMSQPGQGPTEAAEKKEDSVKDDGEESAEAGAERVVRNGKGYRKTAATKPFLKAHTWAEIYARKDSRSGDSHIKKAAESSKSNAGTMDKGKQRAASPPYQRASDVSRSILRYSVVLVLGTLLLSRMITESWTFGYSGRWTNVNNWIPRTMKTFSEAELALYDGSDPTKPIYLGLDGLVYDVSKNPHTYGKGGSYNHFAGRDAARAFVTGCFSTGLTHDVRGLTESEQQTLDGWRSFFSNHAKYHRVGTVIHAPISEHAPLPPKCDPKTEGRGPMP